MSTTYTLTFYAIVATLLFSSFIAGYYCAKRNNHPNVSPNKK